MTSTGDFTIPTIVLRHFDLSSLPYTPTVVTETTARRATYPESKLFIDRLLARYEIDGLSLYPPENPAGLRRLLHTIQTSPATKLQRDCCYYYLLRDYENLDRSSEGNGGMEVDNEDVFGSGQERKSDGRGLAFARKRCIPAMWISVIDGYWELDNGLWESALGHFSDPALTKVPFDSSVIFALAKLVSPPARACSLIYTLLPSNSSAESREVKYLRLIATCSASGIPEAFAWIRSQAPEERDHYREHVWCWAMGAPRIACGGGEHVVQGAALKELLHLPLLPEENAHLISFLSNPPRIISPPALSLLHDLVTLRLIHQGQYQESLQLEKDLAGSSTGGGRDEDRQRRREMIREFVAILPEAQRRVLLIDTEAEGLRRDKEREVNGHASADVDMGSSWVDVAAQPIAAPTPIRHSNALLNTAAPLARTQTNSPFSGPPRFANNGHNSPIPSPVRVHPGSPFTHPKSTASSSRLPTLSAIKQKTIINDDDLDQEPVKQTRSARNKQQVEQDSKVPEVQPTQPTPTARKSSRRQVSNTRLPSPPPPPPEMTPKRPSRSTRQTTAPIMPGEFPPSTTTNRSASLAPPESAATKSRITRSASRAILDEVEEPPKRTKSNTHGRKRQTSVGSEVTDGGESVISLQGLRRSTRRAGTVGLSERGSPTPSARSERSTRNGSATPRMTRSRK